jgi:ATP-dependent exoDNAse (exonuclease V) alpha subunit
VLHIPQNLVIDPSEQTLLYIRGKGGTGKTEVIKAFLFGIELLNKSDQVILSTSTGAAASHIKGSMIHAVLRLSMSSANMASTAAIRRNALRHKRVLIIDEIGIISKKLLRRIDQ